MFLSSTVCSTTMFLSSVQMSGLVLSLPLTLPPRSPWAHPPRQTDRPATPTELQQHPSFLNNALSWHLYSSLLGEMLYTHSEKTKLNAPVLDFALDKCSLNSRRIVLLTICSFYSFKPNNVWSGMFSQTLKPRLWKMSAELNFTPHEQAWQQSSSFSCSVCFDISSPTGNGLWQRRWGFC